MLSKEHLTLEGLKNTIDQSGGLPRLSKELKVAFPNIIPMRDLQLQINKFLIHIDQLDSLGEGCLFVNLIRSSCYITGFQVKLVFNITQHVCDEQLIKSMMQYLDYDNLTIQSRKEAVELRITKFSDINKKIIPFFKQYRIIGVK